MKKRIFGIFFTAIISLLCATQLKAYDFSYVYQGNTLYFNVIGQGVCEVTYQTEDANNYRNIHGAVEIPSEVKNGNTSYSVTQIGRNAFRQCSGITSLTLPNTIHTIDDSAFEFCKNMASVSLPNTVAYIGPSAFYDCNVLAAIEIPNSVIQIGRFAFCYCYALTSVAIPNSVTEIGDGAFGGCTGLRAFYGKFASDDHKSLVVNGVLNSFAPYEMTEYTIPNTVHTLGESVFDGCYDLTSVGIPNTVTRIGTRAFRSCHSLKSINIPNSVTYIGMEAFESCYSAPSLVIPNSVAVIENNAFRYCGGLKTLELPSSVTKIGDGAFYYCSGLTSIYALNRDPQDVTLGYGVFSGVDKTNCTLYVKPGCVDLYKSASQWSFFENIVEISCSTPEFTLQGDQLTIHCATEGASIYYTFGDETPSTSSTKYVDGTPITLSDNRPVNAIASKTDYADSEIARFEPHIYVCERPVVKVEGARVSITCSTPDATLRYTLDGTDPDENSAVYTAPFVAKKDCTVKAKATKEYYDDSPVATARVEYYTCAKPSIAIADQMVVITCATEGASIYYTTDGSEPSDASTLYQGPFSAPEDAAIAAIAYKPGYTPSAIATYNPSAPQCATPEILYNGRDIVLVAEPDQTVYYSVIGSGDYTGQYREYQLYKFPIDAKGVFGIKAYATKIGFNESPEVGREIKAYYDSDYKSVIVYEPGYLSEAFGWANGDYAAVNDLTVTGDLDETDFGMLRALTSVEVLDLQAAATGMIPDGAFEGMTALQCAILPNHVGGCGASLFRNCGNLAAVEWRESVKMGTGALDDVLNPNLLLFVTREQYAPSGYTGNLVVNLSADKITLVDSPYASFYTPYPFDATKVEYIRDFTFPTQIGMRAGWETIVLPFDVEKISHAEKGEITPFVDGAGELHFWLSGIDGGVLRPTDKIKAFLPYAISMPNSPQYANEYNLAGRVTFSASNARIGTSECVAMTFGAFRLVGSMRHINKDQRMSVLNREEYDGKWPGSIFIDGLRDVNAFEAYVLNSDDTPLFAPLPIGDIMDDVNGIDELLCPLTSTSQRMYTSSGTLTIKSEDYCTVQLYTPTGLLVRSVELTPGQNHITGLPSGIYIVKKLL